MGRMYVNESEEAAHIRLMGQIRSPSWKINQSRLAISLQLWYTARL
jgi:hypothetical protein